MYEKFLSKHVQTIKPSGIRKYFDLASEMEGVISLGHFTVVRSCPSRKER